MKDPIVLPGAVPASEKTFGFKREFCNFHFILVGPLVCLLPNKSITNYQTGKI